MLEDLDCFLGSLSLGCSSQILPNVFAAIDFRRHNMYPWLCKAIKNMASRLHWVSFLFVKGWQLEARPAPLRKKEVIMCPHKP